jgi:hypothetical protein
MPFCVEVDAGAFHNVFGAEAPTVTSTKEPPRYSIEGRLASPTRGDVVQNIAHCVSLNCWPAIGIRCTRLSARRVQTSSALAEREIYSLFARACVSQRES